MDKQKRGSHDLKIKEQPCPMCGNLLDYGSRWYKETTKPIIWYRTWTCNSCKYIGHLVDPDDPIICKGCRIPMKLQNAWKQEVDRHGFFSNWQCTKCRIVQREHRCRYRDIECGSLQKNVFSALDLIRKNERNYHQNVDLIGWNELSQEVKNRIIARVHAMHLTTIIPYPQAVENIGRFTHEVFKEFTIWYGTAAILGQNRHVILHIDHATEPYDATCCNAIRWTVPYVSVNGFFSVLPCLLKMDSSLVMHIAIAHMLAGKSFFVIPPFEPGAVSFDDILCTDSVFVTQLTNLRVARDKLPGILVRSENGLWDFSDDCQETLVISEKTT